MSYKQLLMDVCVKATNSDSFRVVKTYNHVNRKWYHVLFNVIKEPDIRYVLISSSDNLPGEIELQLVFDKDYNAITNICYQSIEETLSKQEFDVLSLGLDEKNSKQMDIFMSTEKSASVNTLNKFLFLTEL